MFSVVGGLDYFNKEKYKNNYYISRTMMSPSGLAEVISYFESIENLINPEWNDIQKCMFLYDSLARDFHYEENYDTQIERGVAERSLNGILYKKLVCAGFAQVFKEGLDRLGINNIYQNRKRHHSWNIVELGGKLRGLELTWDCYGKGQDNICRFTYFGSDPDFYKHSGHNLVTEIDWGLDYEERNREDNLIREEETQFELTPFTIDELRVNYQVIAPIIRQRSADTKNLFNSPEEERKMLPIDSLRYEYQKRAEQEQKYILLLKFLQSRNLLEDNSKYNFLNIRNAYIMDIIGSFPSSLIMRHASCFNGNDIGMEELGKNEFHTNGNYNTPFGFSNPVFQEISDENELNKVFEQLKIRLSEYSRDYLINLLNESASLLSKYQQLQNLSFEKDFNVSMIEVDLYTKLQSLIKGKKLLQSYGISSNLIENHIGKIEEYFESMSKKNRVTREEIKENTFDFLSAVFSDKDEVRRLCEQYEGKAFSNEEWETKFKNANYMLNVFDKLKEYDIKQEDLQEILNSISSNTK